MLKVGNSAPDFTLPADDGGQFTLSSLRGRSILLWFFPEADSPGCSLEGRGLLHQGFVEIEQDGFDFHTAPPIHRALSVLQNLTPP